MCPQAFPSNESNSMLPVNKIQQNPYARVIRTLLDESLGQFKPSALVLDMVLTPVGYVLEFIPTMREAATVRRLAKQGKLFRTSGKQICWQAPTVTFTELGAITPRWS